MTNTTYNPDLTTESTPTDAAPLWPRCAAWGLDIALEWAVPYFLAVTGYVSITGIRSLISNQPFDFVMTLSNALYPKALWEAFTNLTSTDATQLDQNLALATLGSALDEAIYIVPVTLLLVMVFFIVNRLMIPVLSGKTVGKQLMGLKIINLKGETPGFGALFLRHVPGMLISSFFFLGYVFALISSERRAWHDYVGGTRVVSDLKYTPEFQRDGAFSSALVHLEAVALIIFFSYFLKLLVLWLKLFGFPVPDFLLPEPPAPPPPLEFTFIEPAQPTPPTKAKRIASANSVAGGVRDPKKPVAAGSPGKTSPTKQTAPKAQAAPEPPDDPAPPPPKPAPAPKASAAPKPDPEPVLPPTVTTPDPAPVSAPALPRTRRSQDLGEALASAPTAQPSTRSTRSSGSLGGPLSVGPDAKGSGPGGRGNNPLFNPDRTAPGRGIDARRDVDFGDYMNRLQARVKRNWIAPGADNSRSTKLTFTVDRNGRVKGLRVSQGSGNTSVDQAAVNAVKQAQPFDPLPSEYDGSEIDIQFTFDISVFGASSDSRGF